jgi:hypothetical membrane protein
MRPRNRRGQLRGDKMTSIGITHGSVSSTVRTSGALQRFMLACGVVASLVYVATDILGGLRYSGYSFTSQAVSELMATGAPSESFVDPLFLLSGAFGLVFGIAVFREGRSDNRALRIAGLLLIAYTLLGFTGPTLFEMHPRGASNMESDAPHLILTGVLVALMLSAIGFAGLALGRRFFTYSLATLLTVVLFGVLTIPFASRLAAGEPTPGLGIIERIMIGAWLLWQSLLAIALLRHQSLREAPSLP